ncbi:MAG: MgtC/SapB family protein [bacterium]|nr:MgtC/SapB family protein [Candidatus Sumerlaeota bacterium]
MTHWLIGNWRQEIAYPWNLIALVFVAVACGWIVGQERARKEKPAGLRTMILVCLGSAVFTMVSFVFTTSTGDSGRVAAQIVTGIGFLGAGAIMRGAMGVSGMTTAATVWAVAAMGIVVGTGYAAAGLGLSCLIFFILSIISIWEYSHIRRSPIGHVTLTFDPNNGKGYVLIMEVLDEYRIIMHRHLCREIDGGLMQLDLDLLQARRDHRQLMARLANMPEVKKIDLSLPNQSPPASAPAPNGEY